HALTIQVDADLLKDANGVAMSTNGLVVLVASTTDSTFNGPTTGAFTTGDDIVVAKFNLASSGAPGVLIDVAASLSFTGNWNPGDPLSIYWYPTLTTNSAGPNAGTPYGMYTTTSPLDGSDAWVTPQSSANIDLRFITSDSDTNNGHLTGSIPASAALANLTVGGIAQPNLGISLPGAGSVNIHLTGVANANYALEYVSALLNANTPWAPLSNAQADANGVINFSDSPGTGPRFYRSKVLP
ncbi:MAG: hypothetical protein JWO95_3492, partial [Verrucomicrobiales bacterium]|nr:hypothetical protein [Verrucomicrobiales bacterium]